jgi:hypothetical protein
MTAPSDPGGRCRGSAGLGRAAASTPHMSRDVVGQDRGRRAVGSLQGVGGDVVRKLFISPVKGSSGPRGLRHPAPRIRAEPATTVHGAELEQAILPPAGTILQPARQGVLGYGERHPQAPRRRVGQHEEGDQGCRSTTFDQRVWAERLCGRIDMATPWPKPPAAIDNPSVGYEAGRSYWQTFHRLEADRSRRPPVRRPQAVADHRCRSPLRTQSLGVRADQR